MIRFYDIVKNKNNMPKLKVIKEFNEYEDTEYLDIIKCLKDEISDLYFESYYIAAFQDYQLIGIMNVSKGDKGSCSAYLNNIMTFIALTGANKCIGFHNHPNNSCRPSDDDITSFYLKHASLKEFDIYLLDDVIITKMGYYSIADEKMEVL